MEQEALNRILSCECVELLNPIHIIKLASINSKWRSEIENMRAWVDFTNKVSLIKKDFYYNLDKYDQYKYKRYLIKKNIENIKSRYLSNKLSIVSLTSGLLGDWHVVDYVYFPPIYYILINMIYKYVQVDIKLPNIEFLSELLIYYRKKLQEDISNENYEDKINIIPLMQLDDIAFCYIHSCLFDPKDKLYDKQYVLINIDDVKQYSEQYTIDNIGEISSSFILTYNSFIKLRNVNY